MSRWKPYSLVAALLACSVSALAQDRPQAFGVQDYTVTTISATSFTSRDSGMVFDTSGSLGRFGATNVISDFYTGVDIPAGAVIDFIGLNSLNSVDFGVGVDLVHRDAAGGTNVLLSLNSTLHGTWATDFNPTPLGYTWTGLSGEALVLHVQTASAPDLQFFGWVEIWWHRSVSPAPGSATFGDVPTGHPFFQFIEALAASGITGGCGSGNYCPDAPLTRGQMAVFLSKALGLHFPGATAPPPPPTVHQ
jgi:S-layer family protein